MPSDTPTDLLRVASLAAALLALPVTVASAQETSAASVEALVPSIEAYVRDAMEQWGTPGLAIGIVAEDRLVYARGFGVREAGGTKPVDSRTLFQIGSSSKAFLGATEAMLVEDGRLGWNDRVIDHDETFRLHDPWVTREFRIRDLLAQRSGLPSSVLSDLMMYAYPPEQVRGALRHIAPESSFRGAFAYQNALHLVAEAIVAEQGGTEDWPAFLDQRLLTPLGMTETSATAAGMIRSDNAARGHEMVDGDLVPAPLTAFPYNSAGAGGINSNVEDLARWLRFQINGGTIDGHLVLSEDALAETRQPLTLVDDGLKESFAVSDAALLHYGAGWVIQSLPEGRLIDHGGLTLGFGAYVGFDPDRRFGIVVLSNQKYPASDGALAAPVGMYVANLLQGAPAKDHAAITLARVRERLDALDAMLRRPDAPLPSRSSDAYLGRYRSDTLGEIEVRAGDGDTLVLQLGPAALPVELTPWSGDIFRADITIPPVTGEGRSTGQSILVRFVPDLSGEITRLEWGGAPNFPDHPPFIRIEQTP